jgi:hypothetical protein
VTSTLPAGWTVERLRAVSGDDTAIPLAPIMTVTADLPGQPAGTSAVTLRPEIVIACHSLCVLKCIDEDDWFTGTINDDGSIVCWAVYPDLEQALRGL